jgi:ea8.5-like protein
MSLVKRQMEQNENKQAVALGIAIEAGVLGSCAIHEDTTIDGSGEVEDAYELGSTKFADGSLKDVFDSEDEMKEYIKAVVEENADAECGQCSKD